MDVKIGTVVALFVSSCLSAGAGAFVGSYLKKKGENLATKEDLKNLVEQMSAVTKATKEIESKISGELWDRQKRWEVQKEAILESLKGLGAAEGLLGKMLYAFRTYPTTSDVDAAKREEAQNEFLTAIQSFWRSKLTTEIVCGQRISDQLDLLDNLMGRIRDRGRQRQFGEAWTLMEEINTGNRNLRSIIREELRFEINLRPQSNVSSAAPSPGSQAPE
jgi:hypothetical protein